MSGWHKWGEKPDRGGVFVVLNPYGYKIATYDAIFEEWTFDRAGGPPKWWMRIPDSPEWGEEQEVNDAEES